jgi:transcriptional regulator
MYIPKHFEERDQAALHALIHANPFGTLVCQTAGGMVANQIPFMLVADEGEHGVLRAHVARANPVWRDALPNVDALVLFNGADSYITPSWYPTKKIAGKAVPTWAYTVVQAYGPPRFIEDADWLLALVSKLSDKQEAGRPEPWAVSDAPEDYIDKLLAAIVGVEIPIRRLEGKFKVDQNKQAVDREGVVAGLSREGNVRSLEIAQLVASKAT